MINLKKEKFLIFGGTGFIGESLVTHLKSQEVELLVITRSVKSENIYKKIDIRNKLELQKISDFSNDCCLINLIGGTPNEIIETGKIIVDAIQASVLKPKKYIYMSSMSVYDNETSQLLREDMSFDWTKPTTYGSAKIFVEKLIEERLRSIVPVVCLRPGRVYGLGGLPWFKRIENLVKSGRMSYLTSSLKGKSNLIHVDDLARLVVAFSTHNINNNFEAFNIRNPEQLNWDEYFGLISKYYDKEFKITNKPVKRFLDLFIFSYLFKILEKLGNYRMAPFTPGLRNALIDSRDLDVRKVQSEFQFDYSSHKLALYNTLRKSSS
jgi:nucleoside-diphosphate-sugar epimerase